MTPEQTETRIIRRCTTISRRSLTDISVEYTVYLALEQKTLEPFNLASQIYQMYTGGE